MGKKTDAQLKLLSDKSDACIKTGNTLLKVLEVWPAIDKEWDKWEDEMTALPDWEQHPYAKKRIAVWDKGKQLANQLKAEVHPLNMALADFKAYITKKEKSKNPFKSKASLPGAKDMIKTYDKVVKDFGDLAQLGTRAFH